MKSKVLRLAALSLFALAGASAASAAAPAASTTGPAFLPKKTVTTEAAEIIADTCLAWYKTNGNPTPPTIWVLDADNNTILVKRSNGSSRIGVETAKMKAESALYLMRSTREGRNFIVPPNGQPNPIGIVQQTLLRAYPSIGGVVIMDGKDLIGAVGVGGMVPEPNRNPDETCAQAGIDAAFKR